MAKRVTTKSKLYNLPIFIEKDEDGFYVVECPIFSGCYTQGRTLDEALKNIEEVIELVLEEKENKEILKNYQSESVGFHSVKMNLNV